VFSQALLVKIVTEILFGQCTFSKSHQTTVLTADHRPAHLKKDRDLDHAHAMGMGRTRVGGSTDALSLGARSKRRGVSPGAAARPLEWTRGMRNEARLATRAWTCPRLKRLFLGAPDSDLFLLACTPSPLPSGSLAVALLHAMVF